MMIFLLNVLVGASLLSKGQAGLSWMDRKQNGAPILAQPEPAGFHEMSLVFVCRKMVEKTNGTARYVPGSLLVRNNDRVSCDFVDKGRGHSEDYFQIFAGPRATTSWRPFKGSLRDPIVGGNLPTGEEVHVCRGTLKSTLKVGWLFENKCYREEHTIIWELENIEYLATNLLRLIL